MNNLNEVYFYYVNLHFKPPFFEEKEKEIVLN